MTPPGGLTCDNGSGSFVGCALDLTSKSTVTFTLASEDCNADGNTLAITSPIQETVFTDGCHTTAGSVFTINGGSSFDAGTALAAADDVGLDRSRQNSAGGPRHRHVPRLDPQLRRR